MSATLTGIGWSTNPAEYRDRVYGAVRKAVQEIASGLGSSTKFYGGAAGLVGGQNLGNGFVTQQNDSVWNTTEDRLIGNVLKDMFGLTSMGDRGYHGVQLDQAGYDAIVSALGGDTRAGGPNGNPTVNLAKFDQLFNTWADANPQKVAQIYEQSGQEAIKDRVDRHSDSFAGGYGPKIVGALAAAGAGGFLPGADIAPGSIGVNIGGQAIGATGAGAAPAAAAGGLTSLRPGDLSNAWSTIPADAAGGIPTSAWLPDAAQLATTGLTPGKNALDEIVVNAQKVTPTTPAPTAAAGASTAAGAGRDALDEIVVQAQHINPTTLPLATGVGAAGAGAALTSAATGGAPVQTGPTNPPVDGTNTGTGGISDALKGLFGDGGMGFTDIVKGIGTIIDIGTGVSSLIAGNKATDAQSDALKAQADASKLSGEAAKEIAAIAREQWEQYKTLYMPAEQKLVADAGTPAPTRLYTPQAYKPNYATADLEGIVNRGSQAAAEVERQYGVAGQALQRGLTRRGIDPTSGAARHTNLVTDISKAADKAAAFTLGNNDAAERARQERIRVSDINRGEDRYAADVGRQENQIADEIARGEGRYAWEAPFSRQLNAVQVGKGLPSAASSGLSSAASASTSSGYGAANLAAQQGIRASQAQQNFGDALTSISKRYPALAALVA